MSRRNLAISGVLVLWAIILAVIVKASLDRLEAPAWGNTIGSNTPLEIGGDTRAGQTFTARWPGLHRVEVTVDQASAGGSGQVTFHLRSDPGSDEDLWTTTLNARDMPAAGVQAFEFPPIRDSQGQSFNFYLESPDAPAGEAIAVGYSPGATLEGATALVNGQPTTGSLQFNTTYSLRTRDRIGLLLAQLVEGRSYLAGNGAFYGGLAIIYGLVLIAFLWLATRAVLQEQKRT